MATMEQPKKVEAASPVEPSPAPTNPVDDVVQEKSVIPHPDEKVQDSKALVVAEKTPDPSVKKSSKGSIERDIALAEVEKEKKLSFIKAWEESEKSKAENKAQKKLSAVTSWENTKKAEIESQLKKIEEQLEKKKADYAEKMRNKAAVIHKQAEEKKAIIEAQRREELLKAEEMSAKYRARGYVPKKILGCFGP